MSDSKNPDWSCVCAVSDLPDQGLSKFEVAGLTVLAARVEDDVRVIPPFCPHMAEPLVESGLCHGLTLTCSKHLWQWNLKSGDIQGPAEKPLKFYPSEIRDGNVWIDASSEVAYDFDEDEDDDFEW
jgi:toluene monooxygenase system ferredoxin subunit